MKVSTKARYGLRILYDLARYGADKPRTISEIANSQNVSEKYVSQLTLKLKKAGLIDSQRGFSGGYTLIKKPNDISILNVVEVMDGPVSILDCVDNPTCCGRVKNCSVRNSWCLMNQKIKEALSQTNLQDILDSDDPIMSFNYSI